MTIRSTSIRLLQAILLVACSAASALDPGLSFFQYPGGKPNPEVDLPSALFDVKQDQQGFLWLASQRGLIKFDGLQTTTYRVSEYPALQSNQISKLFVSSRGELFIASRGGLSVFDGNQFHAVVSDQSWAREIHVIDEQTDGSMWFGSAEGLWRLRPQDSTPEAVTDFDFGEVGSLLWHNNRLLVGALGRLHIIDDEVSTIELPGPLSQTLVRDLVPYQGRVWGATRAGLFSLDKTLVEIPSDEKLVGYGFDVLLADRDDNLWFGGDKSLGRFFPNGDVEHPDLSNVVGIEPAINALIEDSIGRQWDTSSIHGLSLTYVSPSTIRVSFTEGLPSTTVTALAQDHQGAIYLATDLGVSTLRGSTLDDIIKRDFSDGREVRAMVFPDEGSLWLGTRRGLLIYQRRGDTWEPNLDTVSFDRTINAIARDTENRFWMGTDSGLYRLKDGEFSAVFETTGNAVDSLLVDSSGKLWIGTHNSLASLANGQLTHHVIETPNPLGSIVAILELPSGRIIAATADNGILVQKNDGWVLYGEANGLPPEQLISIEYSHQAVWLVTGAGVFRLPLDQLLKDSDTALNLEPAFAHDKYRPTEHVNCCRGINKSSTLLTDQKLVVTTDDGIVSVDLALSNVLDLTPKPYINSVTADTIAIGDYGTTFTLDSSQQLLRIEYSALQLVRGDRVRFRYRLNQHSDWIGLGKARSVELRDLSPGDYRFELQASSRENVWTNESASFDFHRNGRFAESALFKALLWVTAILVGFGLLWLRMAAMRHRHRLLEQRISQRTKALKSVNLELESANRELRRANQTDPLTGLVNRRFFAANSGHDSSEELADRGVLIMIDIDYFKQINDSYGHAVGDDVLCQFADVLTSITRRNDLVTRWGGEEFMLVCQCPNDDAEFVLRRVCNTVNEHRFSVPEGDRIKVSCSVGGIRYPLQDESLSDSLPTLFELADAALYSVKLNGRNGWALLEPNDRSLPRMSPRRMGRSFARLVEEGYLSFSANRPEIQPSADNRASRRRTKHSTAN